MLPVIFLPRIIEAKIINFSLYSGTSEVNVDFSKPIVCLAGANGLGKSTLLNILCYALTGWVRESDYQFKSIKDLRVRDYQSFAFEYFIGRVQETDKEVADVQLKFELGQKKFNVKRGFNKKASFISWGLEDQDQYSESLNEEEYETTITKLAGLVNFSQFVFLIHYILYFDENKELLLWNSMLTTSALFLLFGIDASEAAKADDLAKKIDHLETKYKHSSWDISKENQYISNLKKELESSLTEKDEEQYFNLRSHHQNLTECYDELQSKINKILYEQNSYNSRIASLTAQRFAFRREYDSLYSEAFLGGHINKVKNHPLVKELLDHNKCSICNQNSVNNFIIEKINEEKCPFCGLKLNGNSFDINDISEKLMKFDEKIIKIDFEIEDIKNKFINNEFEQRSLEKKIFELNEELSKISTNFSKQDNNKAINDLISQHITRIKKLEEKKNQYRDERDIVKGEVDKLRKKLSNAYIKAQEEFLPIFKNLAKKFTGLDVNISIRETYRNQRPEIKFSLEIESTDRIYKHQLSESQRYFIDIALRMAFILYVSNTTDGGMLLLDTPEGSLDIAYETNAGEMLADFSRYNKQLILSANINSSGLLTSLAENCGKEKFNLVKMFEWSSLSDVQNKRYPLFESVLNDLEKKMGV